MKQKKQNKRLALIVIIVIIGIILWIFTKAGQLFKSKQELDELNQRKIEIESELKRLYAQLDEKKNLKSALDARVNKVFFWARFVTVFLFLGVNTILFFICFHGEIGVLVDVNTAVFLVLGAILFVIYGKLNAFSDAIDAFNQFMKLKIYGEHLGIEMTISSLEEKTEKLKTEFREIEKKISEFKDDNVVLISTSLDD